MAESVDQIDSVTLNYTKNMAIMEKGEASGNGILRKKSPNTAASAANTSTSLNNSRNQILNNSNEGKNNKKPKNSRLKQQQLPAWQPVLTAKTVLPLFFIIGVIFVVIGAVLLYYSNNVNEYPLQYTTCKNSNNVACADTDLTFNKATNCTCTLSFQLDSDYVKPVYIYYGLKNYYQNHRRYVKSRDDNQLLGKDVSQVNSDCSPYSYDSNNITYAPCGAIANSLFNDTFTLSYNGVDNQTTTNVKLIRTGIAWGSDKNAKFNNPTKWNNTVKPKNWPIPVQDLDTTDSSNSGFKNEDLIVWMRTAALPNFRKFHRRVDHTVASFTNGLPKGYYTVQIGYNYPVTSFEGEKWFIISTTSWMGGKNPFLGIAYIVIGSLCVVLGFVFLAVHLTFGRKVVEEFNALRGDNQS